MCLHQPGLRCGMGKSPPEVCVLLKALGEDVGSLGVGLAEILKQLVHALKGKLDCLFAPGL